MFQTKSQAEEILHSEHNYKDGELGYIDFKANNNLLDRFLLRHNIVNRSVTCIGQKL